MTVSGASDLATEFLVAVELLRITSASSFEFQETRYSAQFAGAHDSAREPTAELIHQITQILYCYYCRSSRATPGGSALSHRTLTEALSEANCGTGTMEPGWEICALATDGRLVVRKNSLTIWAEARDFEAPSGCKVGEKGRLRVPKECRELLPGYYLAVGNAAAAETEAQGEALVRVYWNVARRGGPVLLRLLTTALNERGVPFRLKVASCDATYDRADTAVLYLHSRVYSAARELLATTIAACSLHLRPAVPRFTAAVAPGVAVAEDPGNGESFGQHRCRVIAEAAWTAFKDGRHSFSNRCDELRSRLACAGVNATRPHLNSGSHGNYRIFEG